MRVYLASDHAGFALKESLLAFLKDEGHETIDCGALTFEEHDDYPDYCIPLAQKVAHDEGSFGIVIGLSGQGEAMAANRVRGARAAVFYGDEEEILTLSREHNNANILSLGATFVSTEDAQRAVVRWLAIPFLGEERHARRIAKLDRDFGE
jgi:ribose 5-phosphate isomerase B